ncbi:MAG: protein-disulfide reductase DsbD family protein [Planctomycetota bacterium]|nr:protein-disulfide reductase DsbD family protein [Planctomycetota bacterium]
MKTLALLLLATAALPQDIEVGTPNPATPVTAGVGAHTTSLEVGTVFDVTVRARILNGWHIYDLGGEPGPYADTELELVLPDGLTAVGGWQVPRSLADPTGSGKQIWMGGARFTHQVRVDGQVEEGAQIAANLSFQSCNAQLCLPPKTLELSCELVLVDPWAAQRDLKVLYAGYAGGHRERVFGEFLKQHFDHSATIPLTELSMESAAGFDVVIADWMSQYGCDGYERPDGLHGVPMQLPVGFTKPVVAMTYVGTNLRRGYKLDWL